MFKHIEINNFKSLVNFSIDLQQMSVIVGNNATGKSALLQAIDFMCRSVAEDFTIIIERRDWNVENVKSKMTKGSAKMTFRAIIGLDDHRDYEWEMNLNAISSKNVLELSSEKIRDVDTGELLLEYYSNREGYIQGIDKKIFIPENFVMNASMMKIVAKETKADERILKLKQFLLDSQSFELLSPEKMRSSSRGDVKSIGMSGRDLPCFIKKMDAKKKEAFMTKIQEILGDRIEQVETQATGKPGWIQISTKEKYKNVSVNINSKEMSDGMLRLLAFIAVCEMEKGDATFLLDEIENGINVNYAESLMKILKKNCIEEQHQLIVTTHSTAFLDYVDGTDIIYLYRDDNGETKAKHLFESDKLKQKLEYMWPGEVLLNMSQAELMEKLLEEN